jgi:hypothetical protein
MHATYVQHNDSLDHLEEEIQKKYSRKSKSKWKIAMSHKISLAESDCKWGTRDAKAMILELLVNKCQDLKI